jgi:hypothetical protein
MGLLSWLGSAKAKDRDSAKSGFEKAVSSSGDSKELRALRIRVALRSKTGLDIIFRKAMKAIASHEEEVMIATAGGESPPPTPAADDETCFQSMSTVNGPVTIYIPLDFATRFFDLGVRYQQKEIDTQSALAEGQEIANELGTLLNLDQYMVQPITPLEFLLARDVTDSDID